MSSTSPTASKSLSEAPGTSASRPKRRKRFRPKVYGFLLDPIAIHDEAVAKGTAVNDNFRHTFFFFRKRLAEYCGIRESDLVNVNSPHKEDYGAGGFYCLAVASNFSARSRVPRAELLEKAQEFLGPSAKPMWLNVDMD